MKDGPATYGAFGRQGQVPASILGAFLPAGFVLTKVG